MLARFVGQPSELSWKKNGEREKPRLGSRVAFSAGMGWLARLRIGSRFAGRQSLTRRPFPTGTEYLFVTATVP
jgi:hypothetical protein